MHTDACIGPHPAHVFIQYHVHTDRGKKEVEGEESVEKARQKGKPRANKSRWV